jgi:hypothetical protein
MLEPAGNVSDAAQLVQVQILEEIPERGNMPIDPQEDPPIKPGQPSEPPQESPPGSPRPEVPPPMRDPGEAPRPEELPGRSPDELPGRGPRPPRTPNPTDTGVEDAGL